MSKLKKFLLALVILLFVIQFVRSEENVSSVSSVNHISTVFETPAKVHDILKTSCNDCHSNNTVYPWYNKIQPVAWWLNHHVNEAKGKLNFDEYAGYNLRRQYHKMEETEEMIAENEMPLSSYTFIHRDAILSEEQKQTLVDWSKSIRKQMESKYPIDSLIRKQ